MESRYIVFPEPKRAALLAREVSAPGRDEVMVRLAVSSISSGTERARIMGEKNISITSFDDVPFPRYSGYSSSGVVEAVGEGVTRFHPGDRVALSLSSHSEIQNINQDNVTLLPDDVSFSDAALFQIATFPLAAIRKCLLEIGESAIVMGQGILGQIALPLLRSAGAAPIIAVDPIPEKREKALSCGADYALDPYAADFAKTAKTLTEGGAKVAIEVTGVGQALDGVLDCMAKFGRVALLGCTRHSDFTIDYYHKVHGPGISLIGAHTMARPDVESSHGMWTQRDDVAAVLRLTRLGRIRLSDLVDEVHSPEEAPEVYQRLIQEPSFPLVQFDWRNAPWKK